MSRSGETTSRLSRGLLTLGITTVTAVGCGVDAPVAQEAGRAREQPLSAAESVQQAFDDAACYCEALLLSRAGILTPDEASASGDRRLQRYATKQTPSGQRFACESPSGAAPYEMLPGRGNPVEPIDDFASNACRYTIHMGVGPLPKGMGLPVPAGPEAQVWGEATQMSTMYEVGYAAGFCRADFNYCLAQQLEAKAHSLARPPVTPEIRDGILKAARSYYEWAGTEYAANLSLLAKECPDVADDVPVRFECYRAKEGYGELALNRVQDAAQRAVGVLEDEVRGLLAQSDAITPADVGPPNYAEALWGTGSPRSEAARRIYGTEPLRNKQLAQESGAWQPDSTGQVVAGLMEEVGAYGPVADCRPNGLGQIVTNTTDSDVEQMYHFLDHALLARTQGRTTFPERVPEAVPPGIVDPTRYVDGRAAAEQPPLPPEVSPLKNLYGISMTDVGRGSRLLRVLMKYMDVDVALTPAAADAGGWGAVCPTYNSVRINWATPRQRGVQLWPLASVSSPIQEGTTNASCSWPAGARHRAARYALGLEPLPDGSAVDVVESLFKYTGGVGTVWGRINDGFTLDWREPQPNLSDSMGAAGALLAATHWLRALQARANGLSSIGIDAPAVNEATQLVAGYVGGTWSEYAPPRGNRSSHSVELCGEALVPADGPPPEGPNVEVFEVFDGPMAMHAVECLLTGRLVSDPTADSCDALVAGKYMRAVPAVAVATDAAGIAYTGVVIQESLADRSHLVIANDTARKYLGSVRTGEDRVYVSYLPHEGRLADLYRSINALSPTNPVEPLHTSLGLPRRLVPPIEHELIDNSNSIEDAWRSYLDGAERLATRASRLLGEAVEEEIQILQAERRTEALHEQAAQGEAEAVAAACGSGKAAADCTPAYSAPVTLLDLGLLKAVAPKGTIGEEPKFENYCEEWEEQPSGILLCADRVTSCDEFVEYVFQTVEFDGYPSDECNDAITEFDGDKLKPGMHPIAVFNACVQDNEEFFKEFIKKVMVPGLACAAYETVRVLSETELEGLPLPVRQEIEREGGTGEFVDYDGAVRQEYIHMYRALDDIRRELPHFIREQTAANLGAKLALSSVDFFASNRLDMARCVFAESNRVLSKISDGISSLEGVGSGYGGGGSSGGSGGGKSGGGSAGSGALGYSTDWQKQSEAYSGAHDSFSQAQDVAMTIGDRCNAGNQRAFETTLGQFRQVVETMGRMLGLQGLAQQRVGNFYASAARLDQTLQEIELAEKRRRVDERLASAQDPANSGPWRARSALKARRAREALLQAQRAAYVARRAIEFRLGVDGRLMSKPEALVEAPAAWLDDVFTLHQATGSGGADSAERQVLASGPEIEDYVENLRDFVLGYSFERRYAEDADEQVLSLGVLRPDDARPITETVTNDDGDPVEVTVDYEPAGVPFFQRIDYKCEGYPELRRGGALTPLSWAGAVADDGAPDAAPCTDPETGEQGRVEYALINFGIPQPLEGYLADRLAAGNYNYRIRDIALNLVGSGLIDCAGVGDPQCYADGNVQFSLEQQGYVPIETYEGELRTWYMEKGVIHRARALASERALTNPLSSVDRGLIDQFRRGEWAGRPLGGRFALKIYDAPGFDWKRLEDVQLVLRYGYWTRQQ